MTPKRVEKRRNDSRKARSRPISCFFCRSRKLRCSRQFPCTNCASRGLTCQQENHYSSATPPPTYSSEGLNKPSTLETDVLERLRRLEKIVIGHDGTPQATSNGSSVQAGTPPARSSPGAFVRKFDEYKQSQISPESDVERLEEEITHPGSRVRSNCDFKAERLRYINLTNLCQLSLIPYRLEFKMRSLKVDVPPDFSHSTNNGNSQNKCIWLPLYEESKQIVEKYLIDITHLHHVIHAPSVRGLVDDIYSKLNQKCPLRIGDVCLLMAIITSTTFFWTPCDLFTRPLFSSIEEASEQSSTWLRRTLELLEFSHRVASKTIEAIQATIIAGFVICNLVGISSEAHYWFSSATSVAWQLSLHRIDHPHNGNLNIPPPDSIEAEVGRRVWWYLVGTDWLVAPGL